jgi:hypothetical protein
MNAADSRNANEVTISVRFLFETIWNIFPEEANMFDRISSKMVKNYLLVFFFLSSISSVYSFHKASASQLFWWRRYSFVRSKVLVRSILTSKVKFRMCSNAEYDAIIVGAGFAGLAAARQLHKAGLSVIVLEALDRFGGRAKTTKTDAGQIEMGAQWFHGTKGHPAYEYAVSKGFVDASYNEDEFTSKEMRTYTPTGSVDSSTFYSYLAIFDELWEEMGKKCDLAGANSHRIFPCCAIPSQLHRNPIPGEATDPSAHAFLLRHLPAAAAAAGVQDDAFFRALFDFWCSQQGRIDGGHPRVASPLQVVRRGAAHSTFSSEDGSLTPKRARLSCAATRPALLNNACARVLCSAVCNPHRREDDFAVPSL